MPELVISVGGVHVTREDSGLRITIPTVHSSARLTQAEALTLTKALVRLFKPKSGE